MTTTAHAPSHAEVGAHPTLAAAFAATCRAHADRTALTWRGRHTTYRQLADDAAGLAHSWRNLGVAPGDRIVCSISNRPEWAIALGGAWLAGAVHVGADHGFTVPELSHVIERTGARALVYEPPADAADPFASLHELERLHPGLEVAVVGPPAVPPGFHRLHHLVPLGFGQGAPPPDGAAPDDPAMVFVTSGTTGKPKATIGFHGNLAERWRRLGGWLGFDQDDVHLAQLPLSHGFGLMMAVAALLAGGRLVLAQRFSPDAALDDIEHERVSVLNGAPAHFRLLLDRLDRRPRDVSSLRLSVGTAAVFPAPLVRAIWDRLGVRFMYMYGSSEGVGVATTDADDILLGSVGRPAPESVAIVGADREPLPAGDVGEIAFSRRVFPVRSWGEPGGAGGDWFYSGDRGRLDDEGRLYVYGRIKHQIDHGGLKVDPVEVETALLGCRGIADGTVLGVPDPVVGELVCACVAVTGEQPQPRLGEIREELGKRLAPFKLPEELRYLDAIPRTQVGKVDLAALREQIATVPHIVERR